LVSQLKRAKYEISSDVIVSDVKSVISASFKLIKLSDPPVPYILLLKYIINNKKKRLDRI